jgi:hypothetical protein
VTAGATAGSVKPGCPLSAKAVADADMLLVSFAVVAAAFSLPGLAAFADEEPNNPERSQRVHPPGAGEELRQERGYHHDREPTTGNALDGIRPHQPAKAAAAADIFCPLVLTRSRNEGDGTCAGTPCPLTIIASRSSTGTTGHSCRLRHHLITRALAPQSSHCGERLCRLAAASISLRWSKRPVY